MEGQAWETAVELVDTCRQGVSLSKEQGENAVWNKRLLQKKLRDLALKNKIIRLGKGKKTRSFAVSRENSKRLPSIPFVYCKKGTKHYVILPISSKEKWKFLNRYLLMKDPSSVRKCAKVVFSGTSDNILRSFRGLEREVNPFSLARRLSKEKSDAESHRILNPKINFVVLNV